MINSKLIKKIAGVLGYKLIDKKLFKDVECQIKKIVNLSELKRINPSYFLETIKKDKKNKKNEIRLILTKGIGKMFIKSINKDLKFISLFKKYLFYIQNFKIESV